MPGTDRKGISLVELLVTLAISGFVIAATYGVFISQQRTYGMQDRVIDMQQTMRAALDRMTREIRMAGYGGDILGAFGSVNMFTQIITPVNGANYDSITILVADEVAKLDQNAASGTSQLLLTIPGDVFDTGSRRYLCLNGQNNYLVSGVAGNTVTLSTPLMEDHLINESVFLVKAITYRVLPGTTDLVRDENAGDPAEVEVIAENVEDLQIRYTLASGAVVDSPASPQDIRMVSARFTVRTDPVAMGSGSETLRRTLTSDIEVRNLGL